MTLADAYRVLGVKAGISLAAIRAAHDELAAQWHPDRHASTPQAAELAAARRAELAAALALIVPPAPAVDTGAAATAIETPAHVEPGREIPWHAGQGPLPMPGPPSPFGHAAHRRRQGVRNILVGGALALVGALVTFGTHEAAASSGGGTYLIMYGPMIGGGILFLQGLLQLATSGD